MIFERRYDAGYKQWFAWYPVKLYGPDEWTREKRLHAAPRTVWLRTVWRLRCKPRPYYALPDEFTNNDMLLTAVERAQRQGERNHASTPEAVA